MTQEPLPLVSDTAARPWSIDKLHVPSHARFGRVPEVGEDVSNGEKPRRLREAIAALEEGTVARAAFGDEVVDHYLNYARTEQRLFDQTVTCYERERLFERG